MELIVWIDLIYFFCFPEQRELDDLYLEEARARFEFEELSALKSELERRKRAERKEMEELREELASMQTLYQYRTYSVDSSESSSDEAAEGEGGKEDKGGGGGGKEKGEEVEELTRALKDLMRENGELQEKKQELCQKIQVSSDMNTFDK